MSHDFQKLVRRLVGVGGAQSLSGIDAPLFSGTPGDDDAARLARANGAFLLSLCGGAEAATATTVLENQAAQGCSLAGFLLRLSQWVLAEQQELADQHDDVARKRQEAADWAEHKPNRLGTGRRKRPCGASSFRRGRRVWMIQIERFAL